jgi:hypothetical protein
MRLTGLHETQSIDKFSWGVADRGASVRVPHSFIKNDYKGYLEDRRPNSQGDPYQIASRILKTWPKCRRAEEFSTTLLVPTSNGRPGNRAAVLVRAAWPRAAFQFGVTILRQRRRYAGSLCLDSKSEGATLSKSWSLSAAAMLCLDSKSEGATLAFRYDGRQEYALP